MFLALSLALLTALTVPPAPTGGTVSGHVRSEATGEPLGGAVVELVGVPGARQVIADSTGAYRVDDIPSGRRLLRARHLGYAPLEMEVVVPPGREVQLDVVLRPAPVPLPALKVRGAETRLAGDTAAAPDPELARAASRVLQASPGLAELGLGEQAQGPPGQEPPDPSDVLYVRGTGADLKLVYLDGAPVYAPFPLGGILDAFSPHLLRSADLHLGGAPAKYDGGLSYVLDLRTRAPSTEGAHAEGAVDLLSARALAEAPLGARSGLLVSARGVHSGAGALIGDALPYGYQEVLTRADVAVGGALLSVTAFGNGEEVWLDDARREGSIRWGNAAASAHLRAKVAGSSAEITAAVGDYDANLPARVDSIGPAEGSSRRARLAADFARFSDGIALRYGLAYDRQEQEYRTLSVRHAAGADVAGGYLDVGLQVDPKVSLRGGVRLDHYSLGNALRFAPRLSATWLVGDRAALTLAAGRYHQYLRPPEPALLTPDTATASAPVQPLALGSASHLALTLDQELGAGVRLGVEGYYKSFHDVPGARASDANASGVDVWVRRAEGPWSGWLGYSLAWVWSVDDRIDGTSFAGRQLLTAGLAGPLGGHGNIRLGLVYGAGLPYSAISLTSRTNYVDVRPASDALTPGELTGAPDDPPMIPDPNRPYLRLDLGASRTWSGDWRGAHLEFSPYVRLLNTLGQRDALFYRYERGRDTSPRPLLVLPIVPVIGAEWKI
jgi:hypothetical protein